MASATRPSVCPLDCPDRCTLDVVVDDGRVVSIDGNRTNPLTQGFICSKVRGFAGRVYGLDRLTHPLRRAGAKGTGRFERIGWDEALTTVARRFREIADADGAEAILPYSYGGSNGWVSEGVMDERFFRRLGASRLARTLCAAPTGLAARALYGKMACADLSDFAEAELVILWGANPRHSNIHLMPYLKEAKRRGGRIALVDPRHTLSDDLVDMHLPVYPGTDVALALGMIAYLDERGLVDRDFIDAHTTGFNALRERAAEFPLDRAAEITRVEAGSIRALAEAYAAADTPLVRCGWGLERNRNGESAVAAVLALPAVAGKFGRRGSGYALSTGGAYRYDSESVIGIPPAETRVINMSRLGRVLGEPLDPPIRGLFIYDCNPVVTVPDQGAIEAGLARDDLFTVVHEQVLTDTALFADIVLPATTFLEHSEVSRAYGGYGVYPAEPVIEPVGEALPNEVVFARLGRAMGFEEPLFTEDASAIRARIGAALGPPIRTDGKLPAEGLGFDFPGPTPVPFVTTFPATDDRRVHLFPREMGEGLYRYREVIAGKRFPLALISPATSRTVSSTLGESNLSDPRLRIHPDDASPRGIVDGDWVGIENERGRVEVRARVSSDIRPGVVDLPKGIWRRHTRNGRVATALAPDTVQPVSGGSCYNDARVEVTRLA